MQNQVTLNKLSRLPSTPSTATALRGSAETISHVFSKPGSNLRIAHVGTYPPCKCGIATYMQDVITAVHSNDGVASPVVVAMDTKGEDIRYHWPVRHVITKDRLADYVSVARTLRSEGIDLISVQHEHGIFGGDAGEYLITFLDALQGKVPVVTTFHTVVPDPNDSMRRNICEVAKRSERIVVLNSRAIGILRDKYGIPTYNVTAMPHGTPYFDQSRRRSVREELNVSGQTVLSTFGLLSPGKGLEHAIMAFAENAERHPNLHYYILGATHPGVVRNSGEEYRMKLIAMAAELGVAKRVHFVNRYLELDELKDWLLATDIYVTPYLNANQIVSGTLSYAVAAGKPVLSTPYIHAIELLDGKAGLLTPINDPKKMGENLNRMLSDDKLREQMTAKAKEFGLESAWPQVGKRYLDVYKTAAAKTAAAIETSACKSSAREMSANANVY